MLVIRLRRVGKKNKPTYRLTVAEHTWPVNGKFTADLGSYNPHTKQLNLKNEEAVAWMNKGAKPSNSVSKLFDKEKIKHKSVVILKGNKKPRVKGEETKAPAAAPMGDAADATVVEEVTEAPAEESAVEGADVATPVADAEAEPAPAASAESPTDATTEVPSEA